MESGLQIVSSENDWGIQHRFNELDVEEHEENKLEDEAACWTPVEFDEESRSMTFDVDNGAEIFIIY